MQLATWIREDLKDMADADSLQNLNLLNSRTKRLESLLDDLLAYSRIGRQADELRMVDLNSMLNAIFGLNDHPEGFNLQIKTPLPTFETLAIPLEVIFRNLLINAVKHHDKPQGVVTVTFHDGGEFYHFTVCDDGPGIDPEFHQKIFELFKTLKPRDEVEGSGMGLSIVKKMVEFYGGEIEVNSDGKHGSCFSFSWPKQIVVQD